MGQLSLRLWESVGVKVKRMSMCQVVGGANETETETVTEVEDEREEEEEEEEYCFWAN